MRIVFNATPLLSPLTGVGEYIFNLATGFASEPDMKAEFVYGNRWTNDLREVRPLIGHTKIGRIAKLIPKAGHLRMAYQNYRLRHHFAAGRFDLYHEPNYILLPIEGPKVVTVHDISWIRYPETHPARRLDLFNTFFEPGLRRVDHVITDSEFVKREVMEVFGLPSEKITPVLLGAADIFFPRDADATRSVLQRLGLTHGNYLLAVGTLEPRKNLQLVLHAFMQLPADLRRQYPLVLVGMLGWKTSDLERQIDPLVRAGEIRQTGYLAKDELACVIAGATMMLYPSIYEGFGLPPLEAMASAVPVITSNVASLPEVVGDAGIQLAPDDIDKWRDAIRTLVEDEGLRISLAEKGLVRSRTFSWNHCVRQTVNVYRKVLMSRGVIT